MWSNEIQCQKTKKRDEISWETESWSQLGFNPFIYFRFTLISFHSFLNDFLFIWVDFVNQTREQENKSRCVCQFLGCHYLWQGRCQRQSVWVREKKGERMTHTHKHCYTLREKETCFSFIRIIFFFFYFPPLFFNHQHQHHTVVLMLCAHTMFVNKLRQLIAID